MPKKSFYLRVEDLDKWSAIEDKAEFIHQALNNTVPPVTVATVESPKPLAYGKPDINELFEYWSDVMGFSVNSKTQLNRANASILLKRHTLDEVKLLIDGASMAMTDRYAPKISNFIDLQMKENDLRVWGAKMSSGNTNINNIAPSQRANYVRG